MAIRLNTLLVVLSLPTLLSAAVTLHLWSRKRRNAITPAIESAAQQTENRDDNDKITELESGAGVEAAVTAASTCSPLLSLSDPAPDPIQQCADSRSSSETTPPAIHPQLPVSDSTACSQSLSHSKGPETTTATPSVARSVTPDPSDKTTTDMRITDVSSEVSVTSTTPATTSITSLEKSRKNPTAKSSNGTTVVPNGRPANGTTMCPPEPTTDLSSKMEKLVLKPNGSGGGSSSNKKQQSTESSAKKSSSSSKKEKAHSQAVAATITAEPKAKNQDSSATSPAQSSVNTPADGAGAPDARSRKNHDSGDSVGAVSLDSGADVMSPASSTEAKSTDRSLDSPCLFKSDVSQGSPCNWGSGDSHSEVRY